MAFHMMGHNGVGKRVAENDWERGRFVVEHVDAVQLLHDHIQPIQTAGSQRIHVPNLPMTWADAEHYCPIAAKRSADAAFYDSTADY